MKVLVVAAHSDDEVLGAGGTIARHSAAGDEVHIIYLADGVSSRVGSTEEEIKQRQNMARRACRILGAKPPVFLDFPDNRLDSTPLLDVIQALESRIESIRPDVVYTHFSGDLNVDHQVCHRAVMTACRPLPGSSVRTILSFEVPSSTGWAGQSGGAVFQPSYFVDIVDYLDTKLEALSAYADELRAFPHVRSQQAILALANYRGSGVGIGAAEPFSVERLVR